MFVAVEQERFVESGVRDMLEGKNYRAVDMFSSILVTISVIEQC